MPQTVAVDPPLDAKSMSLTSPVQVTIPTVTLETKTNNDAPKAKRPRDPDQVNPKARIARSRCQSGDDIFARSS